MSGHRSLLAWQTAHRVVSAVIDISQNAWKPYLAAVFSQLQRSSLSVQLNIAEGYASGRGARCRNHLQIAYASAVETEDLLHLLETKELAAREDLAPALADCMQCQRLLRGLIRRYE